MNSKQTPRASNVARGMIAAGTGRKQVFKDRRTKRKAQKDRRFEEQAG